MKTNSKLHIQLLSHTHLSWKKEYINWKIRDEVNINTGFFTYSALKNGTGTYPALANGFLGKSIFRVGYKKKIFTPHSHNVVQNNMSSSTPHKSIWIRTEPTLVPASVMCGKYWPDPILCMLGFNFDGAAGLFTVPH